MSTKRKSQATIKKWSDIIKRYETWENFTHVLLSIQTGYPSASITRWCGIERENIANLQYMKAVSRHPRESV